MKNIFKKNQIIISALAIMIIIAGYLNFSGRNDASKIADIEKSGEVLDYDTYTETSGDDITDGSTVSVEDANATYVGLIDEVGADLANKNDANVDEATAEGTENNDEASQTASEEKGVAAEDTQTEENTEAADISDEDATTEEVAQYDVTDTGEVLVDEDTSKKDEETSAPGEAILVSTTISANYFANAKLNREQIRSKSRETLMEIVNNADLTDAAKEAAVNSIVNLTAIVEKENDTETLLEAKGFSDAVVSIDENNVDVIINATSVTEQDMAQVEDIVKRKTGAKSSEIVISPVIMEE
jgi:stage III sporulation protein AH